ncbi:hypothetical protein C8Q77DRAFT_1162324 [Trametes polyzona]|nr:hypothetical protein C8Q77DRAFT_1162324 [Trametes polyzona]
MFAISIPESLGIPSIPSTIGAVYIGMVVGVMLYGLTVYQAYKYYTLYPKDRLGLKLYITVILLLESFHTVLWTIVCYHYLVTEIFDILTILNAHWSVRLTVLVTGFTVFISQTFYAHRVYYIGPHYRWLVIPAVVSMVTGITFAIIAGIKAFTSMRLITDFKSISWLVSVAYGFSVASDAILAGALVFVLQRSRTGSKRTDTVLDALIKYTINTGLLTSVFSLLVFIFAIILPGNLVYAAISIVTAKLYANSVFAVVNSRKSIGDKFLVDDFTTMQPRVEVDIEQSLVWNVQQRTTGRVTDSIITSQDLSYSTSDGSEPQMAEVAVKDEKRLDLTATARTV